MGPIWVGDIYTYVTTHWPSHMCTNPNTPNLASYQGVKPRRSTYQCRQGLTLIASDEVVMIR